MTHSKGRTKSLTAAGVIIAIAVSFLSAYASQTNFDSRSHAQTAYPTICSDLAHHSCYATSAICTGAGGTVTTSGVCPDSLNPVCCNLNALYITPTQGPCSPVCSKDPAGALPPTTNVRICTKESNGTLLWSKTSYDLCNIVDTTASCTVNGVTGTKTCGRYRDYCSSSLRVWGPCVTPKSYTTTTSWSSTLTSGSCNDFCRRKSIDGNGYCTLLLKNYLNKASGSALCARTGALDCGHTYTNKGTTCNDPDSTSTVRTLEWAKCQCYGIPK
jgi:hypothetical protein